MIQIKSFSLVITIASLISCGTLQREREEEMDFIPLSEYKYKKASIEPGAALQLLAFSGGMQSDIDNIYYCQFFAINKQNGDTIVVLAPLISFPSEETEGRDIHTSPIQLAKPIDQAVYRQMDSTHNLLVQTAAVEKMGNTNSLQDVPSLMHEIKAKQLVVVNRSMPGFKDTNYPAVIGIIHFAERPW